MSKLRVLDLFSGIGGFSLGLERTGGFKTVAFCEIDPFCRRVLAKHWPGVPIYEDVRQLTSDVLDRDGAKAALAQHGDEAFGEWRSLVAGEHVLRSCDGVSVAMERRRLHGVGNAVVPQIPELIGNAILASIRQEAA